MIRKLRLENFRNHKETEMTLDRVNWLAGLSGSGKSSILAALEFGLTSRNEWTDGKGTGSKSQVMNGAKGAQVKITLDDGYVFSRSIPKGRNEEDLPFTEEIIQACLRCRHILELSENGTKEKMGQKELFFSLLDTGNFDLWAGLNTCTPEFPDLGDKFKRYLEGEGIHTDDIDKLHQEAYDCRRDHKKRLAELEKEPLPIKPELHREVTQKELDTAKKQWEQSLKKLAAEDQKLQGESSVYEAKLAEWKALVARDSQARKDLQEAEETVSRAMGELKMEMGKELTFAQMDITEFDKQITATQKEMDRFTGSDRCPPGTCARVELKALNEKMKALQTKRNAKQTEATTLIKKNNEAILAKERAKAAEARWDSLKKIVDELPELPPMPEQPAQGSDDKKLQQLKAQENMFRECLKQMEVDFHRAQDLKLFNEQSAKKQARMEELQQQVDMFDAAEKALGPGGLKTKMLQEGLNRIEKLANEKARFFDFTIEFQADPWGIWVNTGNDFVPVSQLSWSEKARVSAVLQAIVAEASGFGIIGIDEHGMDVSLRPILVQYLLQQDVQSIVLSTLAELDDNGNVIKPEDPGIDGLKLFYVEAGKVMDLSARPEEKPEPMVPAGLQPPLRLVPDADYARGMNEYIARGGRLD